MRPNNYRTFHQYEKNHIGNRPNVNVMDYVLIRNPQANLGSRRMYRLERIIMASHVLQRDYKNMVVCIYSGEKL